MRHDKEKALKLRRAGKSYNEIRRELGAPKSTLSGWLKPYKWSKKISLSLAEASKEKNAVRIRHLNKIRGKHLENLYKQARTEAYEEFEKLKYHPLFIAAVAIYWGEGDKSIKQGLRISNVDPAMIKLFTNFLLHICQLDNDKIYAWLLLYPDLDEKECKNFWIKKTSLINDNFNKSIVIKGRHKTKRVQYGICNVGVSSRYLKEKMLVWVELLPKQLLNKKYYAEVV